jgi:hypothetical protein
MIVLSRSKKAAVRVGVWFSTLTRIGVAIRRKLDPAGLPEKALGYILEVTDR